MWGSGWFGAPYFGQGPLQAETGIPGGIQISGSATVRAQHAPARRRGGGIPVRRRAKPVQHVRVRGQAALAYAGQARIAAVAVPPPVQAWRVPPHAAVLAFSGQSRVTDVSVVVHQAGLIAPSRLAGAARVRTGTPRRTRTREDANRLILALELEEAALV